MSNNAKMVAAILLVGVAVTSIVFLQAPYGMVVVGTELFLLNIALLIYS